MCEGLQGKKQVAHVVLTPIENRSPSPFCTVLTSFLSLPVKSSTPMFEPQILDDTTDQEIFEIAAVYADHLEECQDRRHKLWRKISEFGSYEHGVFGKNQTIFYDQKYEYMTTMVFDQYLLEKEIDYSQELWESFSYNQETSKLDSLKLLVETCQEVIDNECEQNC